MKMLSVSRELQSCGTIIFNGDTRARFDNISTNVGRIVSYQKKEGSPDFINIDLSAKSGNSGSAVLNLEQGYAIGVLCGGSLNHNGELVEEVNYCRPISYIWDLVAKNQDEE